MNIHVRHLDEATVQALKQRAARNGRSAEAEYRAILTAAAAEDADGFDDVAWLECGALGRVDAQAVVAFLHDDHFARDVAEHRAHDTHAEELLK